MEGFGKDVLPKALLDLRMNWNYGSKIQIRDGGEAAREGLPEATFGHNAEGGEEVRIPGERTFLAEGIAHAMALG